MATIAQDNIKESIEEASYRLLDMARELSWNNISTNVKFIISEIKDSNENFFKQRQLIKKENDKKKAISLQELIPAILDIYEDLYDINLHVYRSTKELTIIDFRYYLKSSLNEDYKLEVMGNSPMLHCKISMPPWLSDKKKKFDINWEHNTGWNKWRLFWSKMRN